MPAQLPEGLELACFPEREDPRDCLISRENRKLAELPHGAVVGTSSLRRSAQLLRVRPDLSIKWIRGNIDTRLRKLEEEGMRPSFLAASGLKRFRLYGADHPGIGRKSAFPPLARGPWALNVVQMMRN